MDDFLSILLVAVFYVFIAVSGNKKKKAKNSKRRASRVRGSMFEQAFEDIEVESATTSVMPEPDAQALNEVCEGNRIHLHDVTQQQFHESAEGEDPCHRGSAPAAESGCAEDAFSYDAQEEQQDALAQDILRGVILSEILQRPAERAAIRRNGWSMK